MTRSHLAAALACCACHGGAADVDPGASDDAAIDATSATTVTSSQVCKLLSARDTSDPTANDVQHRANILGADLGIPVAFADTLYLMFGDTIGFAGIWSANESHPDAVGYGLDSAAVVESQPALLCTDLRVLTLAPAQSLGPHVDGSVIADFAGAAMTPPTGHAIGEYIHDPSGAAGAFPNLPGDFEVPSGAFAAGDSIYVFYTTVVGNGNVTMKASYLARWTQPTRTGPPAYQILYQVDERFDANGPLHGHFINIAAEVSGDYVYLFGTGDYRNSQIYLARKRIDALGTAGGFEELGPIVTTAGYGETSVRYLAAIDRWMLVAEELQPTSNRIVAYVAPKPEGPWSAPIVVHDMADPGFRSAYCCAVEDDCQGTQMFNCSKTGFYGTYLVPGAARDGTSITVSYTMSSFSPYNVALFQSTFTNLP